MAKFNPKRKPSKKTENKYKLQNPEKPVLYEEIFPYSLPPLITFNSEFLPIEPAEQIWITDTTFRDGQQGFRPFTPEQILALYDILYEIDNNQGVIRQTEFFLYTERDKKAVELCLARGYKYPELTGWIRANKKDLKLVKQIGLKETGILMSCSDYHIYLKLKLDRKKAMENYLAIVKEALSVGIIPRCHFEDITRADFYGFVIPFAKELMKLSKEAKMPVKIRLCDTLGVGESYPTFALPRSVPNIVYGLHHYAEVPSEYLEWHGHNDFYRAVSNATTAWLYGCSSCNGTMLGIGERTGNTPLEALIFEYIGLTRKTGLNTKGITKMAEYFEKTLNYPIPPNTPFVGKHAYKTSAGIHADGLLKDLKIYTIFDTERILGRPISVSITDKSGTAGIALWINLHLNPSPPIEKTHPGIKKIKRELDKIYAKGRITEISEEEMYKLVKKYMPELF